MKAKQSTFPIPPNCVFSKGGEQIAVSIHEEVDRYYGRMVSVKLYHEDDENWSEIFHFSPHWLKEMINILLRAQKWIANNTKIDDLGTYKLRKQA